MIGNPPDPIVMDVKIPELPVVANVVTVFAAAQFGLPQCTTFKSWFVAS